MKQVTATIWGGPQDGMRIVMPRFIECLEWLVLPKHRHAIFLSDKGMIAPNNLAVRFQRYVYDPEQNLWTYQGVFKESYYG